ncbi:MAG: hypothetical protein U0527_01525 [Candidatus Eisenbacteria bacterium]
MGSRFNDRMRLGRLLALCLVLLLTRSITTAAEPKGALASAAPLSAANAAKPKKEATPNPPETREEAARLLRQNETLERLATLAGVDSFYVLLDPAHSRLKLMLQAAALQDYAVLGLEIGAPRVLFFPRPLPRGWQGRIWRAGELDPPRDLDRKEIVIHALGDTARADSITSALGIPQTPEEKYPVPPRYHIRYEGGLSLEVRLPAANDSVGIVQNTFSRRTHAWWSDVKDALRGTGADRIRLRVILSKDDAKSLYRAIPPKTKLLVLPSDPES